MTFTERMLEAERIGFLSGQMREEVYAYLTSTGVGILEKEYEEGE